MKPTKHNTGHALAYSLAAFTLSLSCLNATASGDEFFLDHFENFGIEENDFDKMQLVPTHMMDNDQLFRAAAADRDTSMTMSQRLINNRWLLSNENISFSASAALRRYLSMHLMKNYKRELKRSRKETPEELYLSNKRGDQRSQFSDISNYRMRVSDDHFRLRFRYRFD